MHYSLQKLWVLIKRMSILFVIYQLLRFIFFVYNKHHFTDVGLSGYLRMMWGGLRFDLTAILYLNAIFVILSMLPVRFKHNSGFKRLLFYLFIVTNSIGFALNLMDIFYFDYVLKRSTIEVFMFTHEKNIFSLLSQFAQDFWLGFVLFILFVIVTIKFYKYVSTNDGLENYTQKFYPKGIIVLVLVIFFMIIGIRSSFIGDRPLHQNNAGAYVQKPLEMAIVLNTPFTVIRTIRKSRLKPVHYFNEQELAKIYEPKMHFVSDSSFLQKNIMIIIVESLAREYTGLLNRDIKNYKGYTPFLDSLMLQSHTFTNAYANGRRSIDAMPSILASIPSLTQSFVLSPYGADNFIGLGDILKEKGYKTAFFHGANNGSMGFNAFVKLAGIDEYYGMNEYGNNKDYDGHWGIPDDKFLQYTVKQLDTFTKPFMATLFTLSSHHPFTMPTEDKYKGLFYEGTLPIHKTIEYVDFSLRNFFKSASKSSWYHNTIFVITADHCNLTDLPEYKSSTGHHAIPIIFFEPDSKAKLDSTLMQQIDIMPRLLRKLNYSGDFISFGNDPDNSKSPFVINYTGNTWEFMQNDYLLRFRKDKPISLYNYKEDRLLRKSIMSKHKKITSEMTKQLKAFIQQYKNRLIQNRLTINN